MHVNDCFLVLVFISDTSVFLNKFFQVFLTVQSLYQQYFQGDLLLSDTQCLLEFLCFVCRLYFIFISSLISRL